MSEPKASRTGKSASSYAASRIGGHMPDSGLCLQFVRENFAIPSYYASAADAWNGAQHKHTNRPTTGAVPVFFNTPSAYNHVAFYDYDGTVITTDGSAIERWKSIDSVASAFGGPYMGWTEDLNGYYLYTGGSSGGTITLTADGMWGSDTTRRLQQYAGHSQDGTVSSQDDAWKSQNPGLTSGWQWVSGTPKGSQIIAWIQGRVGVSSDGLIGPSTIKAMQRHFGTPQDGKVSKNSQMVIAMQKSLNTGKF